MKLRTLFLSTIIIASLAVITNAQTTDFKAALKRGDALVVQEKHALAITEYSTITENAGELYARAIYNIGVCYYELWQTGEAIRFYEKAIELRKGNYPRASYSLGVAFEDQGNRAAARAAYEQSIKASQRQFGPAIYRLALLEAQAGEPAKAAALFREAASREGAHVPASHNNLGVMLTRLGLFKEAEEQFATALRKSDGALADAARNLNLCRSLTATLSRR